MKCILDLPILFVMAPAVPTYTLLAADFDREARPVAGSAMSCSSPSPS